MRFIAPVLLLVAAGCTDSSTQVVVNVIGPAGAPDPSLLEVNVFDGFGRIVHSEIMGPHLPVDVILAMPNEGQVVRIVAVGTGGGATMLGGTRVSVLSGRSTNATVAIAPGVADADDDFVPDNLDDCATANDPLQENVAGSGDGDACRPGTLDLGVDSDLAVGGGSTDMAGAGPSDLAGVASPPDLGPVGSRCASAGVPFCDGFENFALATHWIAVVQTNGTVAVDTTRAYRGSSSLHVHQNALSAKQFGDIEVVETQSFPSTHLWVRAFVFVPTVFDAADADLVFLEQNVNPYTGVLMGVQGTSFHTNNTISGTRKTSTTPMARNQWVCLEWEVLLGASGTTTLSVDGTVANGLSGTQNLAVSPAIGQLGLSMVATAPATAGIAARDVWFDEVIVDTQPIGCTK